MKKCMPKLVLKRETIEALDSRETKQAVAGDVVSHPYLLCTPPN